MKTYEFKYDIGSTVYTVKKELERDYHNCDTCEGKRSILIKDERFTCPKCGGKGYNILGNTHAYNIKKLTIVGQCVRIDTDFGVATIKEEYKCAAPKECGIMYSVSTLYTTRSLAQAAIDKIKEEGNNNE